MRKGACQMRRLMIIDDEFIFRQGLKYMMDWEANNYTIAGEASNGKGRSGTFSETPARYRTLRRCHAGNQRHPVCRNAPPLFQSPDCNAQ